MDMGHFYLDLYIYIYIYIYICVCVCVCVCVCGLFHLVKFGNMFICYCWE